MNHPLVQFSKKSREQMYLHYTPNDKRTWVHPTHNRATDFLTEDSLELVEDINGNIFLEEFSCKDTGVSFWYRISAEKYKSKDSISLKRYRLHL